ncbi:MAG: hypothetical protein IJH50_10425 [Kiritimatiellae bacterium]|nr:hypothetical protein [Kiritimatiellia bacterium]
MKDGKIVESSDDGKTVRCTVRSVHKEGVAVSVELDGQIVNGVISPRCYGVGEERMKALAAINPGDAIEAVVRLYDAHTKSCSLVLPGFKDLPRLPKKQKPQVDDKGRRFGRVMKPMFKPEEAGTTFVFDFANVCAALPMHVVPNAKVAIEGRFAASGYSTLFYLEKRAAGWISHNLVSNQAKDKFFGDLRANGNASFVGSHRKSCDLSCKCGEADLAILQTVGAVEHSVAVSRDGYADYEETFGEVVSNRVRGFSVVVLPNGSAILTVEGAKEAVVIPPFDEVERSTAA